MLIKDLYLDCIKNQISSVAHYIYHLLEEQKLSLDDDSSKIVSVKADLQKVNEMIKNDVLGIYRVSIYSLKMNQNDFVFIFSYSDVGAIQFYRRTFGNSPLNCHEIPLDYTFYRGNDVISFRDMKKEVKNFQLLQDILHDKGRRIRYEKRNGSYRHDRSSSQYRILFRTITERRICTRDPPAGDRKSRK